jgi:hypothetical protein
MELVNAMLAGAIMISAWAIFVFFVRFWRKTRDRLFLFFASAFLLLGIERVILLATSGQVQFIHYVVRLCAFLLIVIGVFNKNRAGK